MTKGKLAHTATTAFLAGVVTFQVTRPTLTQVSQFSIMHNAEDAQLTSRGPWDYDITATVDIDGVRTKAMLTMRTLGPAPVDPTGAWAEKVDGNLVLHAGAESFGPRPVQFETFVDPTDLPLGAEPGAWGPGWRPGLICSDGLRRSPSVVLEDGEQIIRADIGPDTWCSSAAVEFPAAKVFYASWWTLFGPATDDGSCGANGPQWKMWRLGDTANFDASHNNFLGEIMSSGNHWPATGRHNFYTMLYCAQPGDWDCNVKPATCFPFGYPNGQYSELWHNFDVTGVAIPKDDGKWVRWEVYVEASSQPGRKDGSYVYRCSIPGEPVWEVDWSNSICTHRDLESTPGVNEWGTYSRFMLQNQWSNCSSTLTVRHDDIQVQTGTAARVELGDAPLWEDCTVRWAAQIVSWSEDRIVVEPWEGDRDETWYAYVVRDDMTMSEGIAEP